MLQGGASQETAADVVAAWAHLGDKGGMGRQSVSTGAFADVPDAAGVVVAARCKDVAIRGPVHGEDVFHMPL